MCDTFVAIPAHTASGNLIFGKNSDREPNEAQAIVRFPASKTDAKTLHCTYITIPQVSETHEVILSKPFQMWGAEMGINEHGLVIGNEAVFTKIKIAKKNTGLTGMDLLRLALERCKTALSALETITELLEQYGQDACGGYENRSFFYHNSFIIADSSEAWVLETAGRHWAAQKVRGFHSISNGLTIGEDYDLLSSQAINFARRQGSLKKGQNFNFKKSYSDWFYTKMSNCKLRQAQSSDLGNQCKGTFSVRDATDILSTHPVNSTDFQPSKCTSASICMHATGLTNPSQTTGSMIAEIREELPATIWLTGTSTPCLSVYKPFFIGSKWEIDTPGNKADNSLWWQAELLHRSICKDYQKGFLLIKQDRQALQEQFFQQEASLFQKISDKTTLYQFSKNALDEYYHYLKKWKSKLAENKLKEWSWNPFYRQFIKQKNRIVIPVRR